MGKYSTWILLFAVAGTLSAVAAIAINEAFVSATLLVLTVGEWELLAAVFYILAIILYLGEQGHIGGRGVVALAAPSFKGFGARQVRARTEDHDATYASTLEEATA
jgi:hypothetical protein